MSQVEFFRSVFPLAHLGQKRRPTRRLGVALKPLRRQRKLLHLPQPMRADPPRRALYHDHWPWLLQRFPSDALSRLQPCLAPNFPLPSPVAILLSGASFARMALSGSSPRYGEEPGSEGGGEKFGGVQSSCG